MVFAAVCAVCDSAVFLLCVFANGRNALVLPYQNTDTVKQEIRHV